MPTKRSNQSWVAPRSGGYSAKSSTARSVLTGRFVKQSAAKIHPKTAVGEVRDSKPAPPTGPGAASTVRASKGQP